MPIYYNESFSILFIHVPKASGTFIKTILSSAGLYEVLESRDPEFLFSSLQHIEAERISHLVDLSKITYFFCVVRDPAQRLISEYFYRMKIARTSNDIDPYFDLNDWIIKTLKKFKDNPFILDNHIRPQAHFLLPNVNIFRIEDECQMLKQWLIGKIGNAKNTHIIDLLAPPNIYVSPHKLAEVAIELFHDIYSVDYALLEYDITKSLESAGFIAT